MRMIISFLLLTLMEVSWASQMEKQGSGPKKVGEEQGATNREQEQLDWALDQLPHHRTKRCQKHDFCVSEIDAARFLFLTEEKRLVMPPGSKLVLTPTLALPFLR